MLTVIPAPMGKARWLLSRSGRFAFSIRPDVHFPELLVSLLLPPLPLLPLLPFFPFRFVSHISGSLRLAEDNQQLSHGTGVIFDGHHHQRRTLFVRNCAVILEIYGAQRDLRFRNAFPSRLWVSPWPRRHACHKREASGLQII